MDETVEKIRSKHLLFDDEFVQDKRGVSLRLQQPLCRRGPLLVPDKPWEEGGLLGDSNMSVIEDGGKYMLWYVVPHRNAGAKGIEEFKKSLHPSELKNMDEKMLADLSSRSTPMLCYAYSQDGIEWEKPELGMVEYDGSRKNNIVSVGRAGCTVFLDPRAPRAERYKMIYGGGPRLPHINMNDNSSPGNVYHAVYGASSPDGIKWKPYTEPVMPWYKDTTNVCYWDDEKNKYAAFVRWNEGMTYKAGKTFSRKPGRIDYRAVGRSESKNFRKFPAPVKIHEPVEKERYPYKSGMDYYNSAAVKYPFAPSSYFLFVSDFYHDSDMLDVHLAAGRDGETYTHWKEPFVSPGEEGEFDSKCIYMAAGMIEKGDEIWMYYAGYNYVHRDGVPSRRPHRSGGLGLVRVRKDGFVSQTFAQTGGSLTTVPVKTGGNSLKVNMDAGAGGRLKAELLDEKNRPVQGFGADECCWMYGNDTKRTVSWNGNPNLGVLKEKKVRIKFTGRKVKLYSFEFSGT